MKKGYYIGIIWALFIALLGTYLDLHKRELKGLAFTSDDLACIFLFRFSIWICLAMTGIFVYYRVKRKWGDG